MISWNLIFSHYFQLSTVMSLRRSHQCNCCFLRRRKKWFLILYPFFVPPGWDDETDRVWVVAAASQFARFDGYGEEGIYNLNTAFSSFLILQAERYPHCWHPLTYTLQTRLFRESRVPLRQLPPSLCAISCNTTTRYSSIYHHNAT